MAQADPELTQQSEEPLVAGIGLGEETELEELMASFDWTGEDSWRKLRCEIYRTGLDERRATVRDPKLATVFHPVTRKYLMSNYGEGLFKVRVLGLKHEDNRQSSPLGKTGNIRIEKDPLEFSPPTPITPVGDQKESIDFESPDGEQEEDLFSGLKRVNQAPSAILQAVQTAHARETKAREAAQMAAAEARAKESEVNTAVELFKEMNQGRSRESDSGSSSALVEMLKNEIGSLRSELSDVRKERVTSEAGLQRAHLSQLTEIRREHKEAVDSILKEQRDHVDRLTKEHRDQLKEANERSDRQLKEARDSGKDLVSIVEQRYKGQIDLQKANFEGYVLQLEARVKDVAEELEKERKRTEKAEAKLRELQDKLVEVRIGAIKAEMAGSKTKGDEVSMLTNAVEKVQVISDIIGKNDKPPAEGIAGKVFDLFQSGTINSVIGSTADAINRVGWGRGEVPSVGEGGDTTQTQALPPSTGGTTQQSALSAWDQYIRGEAPPQTTVEQQPPSSAPPTSEPVAAEAQQQPPAENTEGAESPAEPSFSFEFPPEMVKMFASEVEKSAIDGMEPAEFVSLTRSRVGSDTVARISSFSADDLIEQMRKNDIYPSFTAKRFLREVLVEARKKEEDVEIVEE
jgi:hypothetical protein